MPASKSKPSTGYGSLFEEDYLVRTLGRIAHDPDVALTELVANAWDAGALTVPTMKKGVLVVADDGHGMSPAQFKNRWMTLGRHGLLCFSDRYEVETSQDGKNSHFVVSTQSQVTPFIVETERTVEGKGPPNRRT